VNQQTEAFPELAEAIAAVREQLTRAQKEGAGAGLRFRVGPVELEFDMVMSRTAGGEGGLKVYVLTLGAKGESTSGSTHRIKVTLQPIDPATGEDAKVAGTAGSAGPPGGWAQPPDTPG
jgi:hypothetical protein